MLRLKKEWFKNGSKGICHKLVMKRFQPDDHGVVFTKVYVENYKEKCTAAATLVHKKPT